MKISIFGLGYVGAVSAGCLAREGHEIIGVDPYHTKVELVNRGKSPVIERDISDIIARVVKEGRLRATTNVREAVDNSRLSLICVGTPSQLNGNSDLRYVRKVCEEIGAALGNKADFHVIVTRSTMLPGSIRNLVIPTLEGASGKRCGLDFSVCHNPEFLREGTAVHDFFNPPKTVIGEADTRSGDVLADLYKNIDAPMIRTDIDTAEMVKYADNVWHALKVGFANEIGNICKAIGIDSHEVMDIFCKDTKLNLSSCYLKPGFAFGGSCLPKDVRALTYKARTLDLDVPILSAILSSNRLQIEKGLQMITEKRRKKVGILGLSFKANTDDLRESPVVEVVERLLGKGYDVRIYDPNIHIASLVGANRDYILNQIPHISKLMVGSIDEVLHYSEIVVIGNNDSDFRTVPELLNEQQVLVDFVHITDSRSQGSKYDGICW
jgi:nucleotide sugar dehydrogenase